ncbi:MAG: hypothetical protein IK005_11120, partial [Paludibacteraceae bacterium]|nr:hypothetical protein [Paludibacteraceae bacterium]
SVISPLQSNTISHCPFMSALTICAASIIDPEFPVLPVFSELVVLTVNVLIACVLTEADNNKNKEAYLFTDLVKLNIKLK